MTRKVLRIYSRSKSTKESFASLLHIDGAKIYANEHSWSWDAETLTASPSVRSNDGMYHYFLRNGKIENCGDTIINDLEVTEITLLTSEKDEDGWNVIKREVFKENHDR